MVLIEKVIYVSVMKSGWTESNYQSITVINWLS